MSDAPESPPRSPSVSPAALQQLLDGLVTEAAELREALRASDERTRAIGRAAPFGIFQADLDGNVTYVNPGIADIWGVPRSAMLGRGWTARVHPDDLRPLLAAWSVANAGGRNHVEEFRIVLDDGAVRVLRGRTAVLRDGAGAAVGSVGTVEDVTERRRAESALRASEARLAGIIGSATDAILTTDAQQRIVLANEAAERVFGYPVAELLGQPLDLLIPERFRASHHEHVARFGRTGASTRAMGAPGALSHVDLAARRRDGSEFPIEASISQVVTDEGTFYTVILRDVTERRRGDAERERLLVAERRAARSTRLLQSLTAAFSAVLTPVEVVGVVLEQAVPALGARTGLVSLLGDDGVLEVIGARGYAPELIDRFTRTPLDAPSAIATVARTGEPRWLTDPAAAVREFPMIADVYAALGIRATAALPLRRGHGRPFGVLAFNFDAPRDFDTDDRTLLSALADQCAQALERARLFEAERAAGEEAQRRRGEAEEANAAKSRFLATTSHEIRTPINAILGYTELLEMGIAGPLTDEQSRYLARLRLSGRHLLGVINQVLDLSKIEADKIVLRPRAAPAAAAATRATALVEPQAVARGVTLANACEVAADVTYTGDPERVEQILVNLVTNAVKFTPNGGRVTLTCGNARTPTPDAEVAAEPAAGWTYFRVEDTGIGVPPERLRAIWEPFEQADVGHSRAYGGTGLGLTISRRLARLMGGDVTVRSEPGAGSTFFVWLPAASAPEGAAPAPPRGRGGGRPPARPRAGTRHARGLGKAADAALAEIEHVLSGYAARLRVDPETPSAWKLSEAEIEDHTATFLADMAQCLALVEAARGAPSESMRDGSAIQRVIAERHGAQRARLGWAEGELRREFAILREELAAAVRRRVGGAPDVALDDAIALLAGFVDHAERTSVETHRAPPAPER